MGLRPAKCEICGQFMREYRLHVFPSDILALEPNEPSCLCKKCYKQEVLGQDHEVYRVGPKKDIIVTKDAMNMILNWNVDEIP